MPLTPPQNSQKLKYLGIYITSKPALLFRENYIPLLNYIRDDLHRWNQPAYSWLGRNSVIKMNILPRLIFMLQMIPYTIPVGFFLTLNSLIYKYIWHHSYQTERGLALPDFKNCFLAFILNRISDWKYHQSSKQLEYDISKAERFTLLWIP